MALRDRGPGRQSDWSPAGYAGGRCESAVGILGRAAITRRNVYRSAPRSVKPVYARSMAPPLLIPPDHGADDKEHDMRKSVSMGMIAVGAVITFGGFTAPAQADQDVPCGTPAVAAFDEVVHHDAEPATVGTVHHDAKPAVTHTVHTDGTPAVTHKEFLWSNPPGQGNHDNPGKGDEQGHEERWLPEGVDPPGNNKPGTPGAWFKIDTRVVVDTPAVPGSDVTVIDKPAVPAYDETVTTPGKAAYDETVHHPAVPAGADCPVPTDTDNPPTGTDNPPTGTDNPPTDTDNPPTDTTPNTPTGTTPSGTTPDAPQVSVVPVGGVAAGGGDGGPGFPIWTFAAGVAFLAAAGATVRKVVTA